MINTFTNDATVVKAEERFTTKGHQVVTLRLASNRGDEPTAFYNAVFFEPQSQWLMSAGPRSGDKIVIQARVKGTCYQANGKTYEGIEFVVSEFRLLPAARNAPTPELAAEELQAAPTPELAAEEQAQAKAKRRRT